MATRSRFASKELGPPAPGGLPHPNTGLCAPAIEPEEAGLGSQDPRTRLPSQCSATDLATLRPSELQFL